MPLSTERLPNKPLAGTELAKFILADLEDVLARSGMFSSYIAYGRVAYTVKVELHVANPTMPKTLVTARGKRVAVNAPADDPRRVIEGEPPLHDPGPDSAVVSLTRERTIESPNAARIASGQPIEVQVHKDGQLTTRKVQYDPADIPKQPDPVDRDDSDKAAQEWKVKARPPHEVA